MFDVTDGDICFGSGSTIIDSKGNMMHRLSDHTAMDLNTGKIHIGNFSTTNHFDEKNNEDFLNIFNIFDD